MTVSVPPEGTVTLLFTDIEGSTKRWESLPQAMAVALQTHDRILRTAIEQHRGFVFKTIGDAFCAAFSEPADALAATIAAQHALAAEPWGDVGPVRVRMALHTGEPEHRDRDYFGPPVNRVARLLATGCGDQIIVSAVTAARVTTQLPPDTSLLDLGVHRLKDLLQPEHVYQVVAPGLPADFPPLKSLDRKLYNLPAQPTPLVGREAEVARARELIETGGCRLVTLIGPGGTGKSRLGLQVAAELVDAFSDGVWFVPLAAITDPNLVAGAIATPLGVRESGTESLEQTLIDYMRDRRVLLVIDNFEQVTGAAPLIGRLLAACPDIVMIVTSRTALRVYGERELPVPPLHLPNLTALPPLAELEKIEAVELFVERAMAIKPGFALTAENARPVAEICVRLEGLPLAIELAAARVRVLTPEKLLERLAKRLDLLTGGAADRDTRQQTLRGAIAWSYDLLSRGEQHLFRRLSVFAGGCDFDAVEQVCNAEGDLKIDVLDGLESLVTKSLLRQEEINGDVRFRMLEMIREFASEQLDESGEASALRTQHASQMLLLAERAEINLTGPEQGRWMARLETDHDNLRAALHWLDAKGDPAQARLAAALWRFWMVRGHLTEGRGHLERVVRGHAGDGGAIDHHTRAQTLLGAGWLAWGQGDYQHAETLHEHSEACARSVGDQIGIARALHGRAEVARARSDYRRARALHTEALALARQAGDRVGITQGLTALGNLEAIVEGNLDAAAEHFAQAVAIDRELGDLQGLSIGLGNLAAVQFLRGEYEGASRGYDEQLSISRDIGDAQTTALALVNQAEVRLYQGDDDGALRLGEEALRAFRELGDRYYQVFALVTLGRAALLAGQPSRGGDSLCEALAIAYELGDASSVPQCLEGIGLAAIEHAGADTAALLFGAAAAIRDAVGIPVPEIDLGAYDSMLSALRAELGDASFESAWSLGCAMSTAQAVDEALALIRVPAHS